MKDFWEEEQGHGKRKETLRRTRKAKEPSSIFLMELLTFQMKVRAEYAAGDRG